MIPAEDLPHKRTEEENYFVSMTDMMVGLVFIFVILLMYFVLQFKNTQQELEEQNKRIQIVRADILNQIKRTLDEQGVTVVIDEANGILRLPDAILFDSGKSELKPDGVIAVQKLASSLRVVLPCYVDQPRLDQDACPRNIGNYRVETVMIEGHTDSVPYRGVPPLRDNWDLSVARATNTYRTLIEGEAILTSLCTNTISGDMCVPIVSVSGYAETRPVTSVDQSLTVERRNANNRRIDVRFVMKTPDLGKARGEVEQEYLRR